MVFDYIAIVFLIQAHPFEFSLNPPGLGSNRILERQVLVAFSDAHLILRVGAVNRIPQNSNEFDPGKW